MSGEIVCGHGGVLDESLPTLRAAAELCVALGAPMVIVFGYDPPLAGGEVGDLRRVASAFGENALSEAKAAVLAASPTCLVETVLVEDRPTESILFVAASRQARMIVVGHGGTGPVRGALLGSVAYNLVHRSPVPVLVVPMPDE